MSIRESTSSDISRLVIAGALLASSQERRASNQTRFLYTLIDLKLNKIFLEKQLKIFKEISKAPLFSQERLSLTSRITPDWLCLTRRTEDDALDDKYREYREIDWRNSTNVVGKIQRVFFELIKTILFFTLVAPIFTFVVDIIKFSINRPAWQKEEQELAGEITKVDSVIEKIHSQLKHAACRELLKIALLITAIIIPSAVGLNYIINSCSVRAALIGLGRFAVNFACPYINGTFGVRC
jgi:hypothetical protein